MFLFSIAALCVPATHADELQTTAQALTKKYDSALVRIHITGRVQLRDFKRDFDQKDQTTMAQAVIIDERGIAVATRSHIDSSTLMGITLHNSEGEQRSLALKNKFKKIEMELADGWRVPARILIVDPKWDLVLLVPKKPLKPEQFAYVPIRSRVEAETLEQLILIRRGSPLLDNQVAVALANVSAVLEKPMRMYYATPEMWPSFPAFNVQGELIGISAMKWPDLSEIATGKKPVYVILPCSYISRVLKQAEQYLE